MTPKQKYLNQVKKTITLTKKPKPTLILTKKKEVKPNLRNKRRLA